MTPGFYVLRQTHTGKSLKLESVCFKDKGDAESWREWVASQYPKDTVMLIEVLGS